MARAVIVTAATAQTRSHRQTPGLRCVQLAPTTPACFCGSTSPGTDSLSNGKTSAGTITRARKPREHFLTFILVSYRVRICTSAEGEVGTQGHAVIVGIATIVIEWSFTVYIIMRATNSIIDTL